MTSELITNIGQLITNDPEAGRGVLGERRDAAVMITDGMITWIGSPGQAPPADRRTDAGSGCVLPGFVDSHSHIVFAGDRSEEFAARMTGRPYTAGGIRHTVAATRAATDDQLRQQAGRLIAEMRRQGSTSTEIKSGYGLTVADEERMVRVAAELSDDVTFLGAHLIPDEYADDRTGYVDLVCGPMLAACRPYSRWIDVFCETGAFTADESRRILTAGAQQGLGVRMHASQLAPGGGVALATELGAASVDHCTYLTPSDIDALADSARGADVATVATVLPGVEFSTRQPYPDARRLWDAGAVVAIASDCNPGSCFTSSIPFCIALAVREMGLSPAEAVWSATAGGAAALRRTDIGAITVGARADLIQLSAPNITYLAYRPGVHQIARVWSAGVPL